MAQLEIVIEINFSTIDRMKLAVMYRLHTSLTDTKLEPYRVKVYRLDSILMVITVTPMGIPVRKNLKR